MSTHGSIDKICVAVLILSLLITVIFMNGQSLGMEVIVDEDDEAHSDVISFTENDLNPKEDWGDATKVLLGDKIVIDGGGAFDNNGSLYISNAGSYVISGTLKGGNIVVDTYSSSKVYILLKGVDISCDTDACIKVEEADKVFLTLAEGSENHLTCNAGSEVQDAADDAADRAGTGRDTSDIAAADSSGSGQDTEDSAAEGRSGAIFTRDDLTINGVGSLTVNSKYWHGIESNDDLVITGGTIDIVSGGDGINVNDGFRMTNADLTISAPDNDGIHSDTDILIDGGNLMIEDCYEGLEAHRIDVTGGDVEVHSTDDGFNAYGGSSSFGFGGGHGGFGGAQMPGGMERPDGAQMQGGMERPDGAQMPGGMAPPDGAQMQGGMERPDGQVSGNFAKRDFMNKREGVSGNRAHGPRSEMRQQEKSSVTEEDAEEEIWIHISGGSVTIINETGRDSDGLDSNGDIVITGGDIRISMPGEGGNCALDCASENGGKCTISGGTVIAAGGAGMAESFDESSLQSSYMYYPDGACESGILTLSDTDGNIILSGGIKNSFTSVVLSAPQLKKGETYILTIGDHSEEIVI